jgi:hypothetical protein
VCQSNQLFLIFKYISKILQSADSKEKLVNRF